MGLIVIFTAADVADAYGLLSVIAAVIVQVPALTNVIRPDVASMVQTEVVELEYDLVPASLTVTVDVSVGLVATSNAYGEPAYEGASMVIVRTVSDVTLMVIAADVAAEYVPSPASSARTVHDPVLVALAVKVEPEIKQYRVPVSTV